MAGTDARGFSYVLEPVRRRREWKLDAALARLGNLHKRLAEKRAAVDALREQCAAQASQASQSWITRSDPVARVRILEYLAAVHVRAVQIESEIGVLEVELRLAREQCAAQQQALQAMERHRAEMLQSYAVVEAGKLSARADANWIARDQERFAEEHSR